jgi:pimeloyl-ACP methyl ester carboxylesterase
VIVPYLRGYGPTRFLSADTLRSGQQAVLGHDLLELMDALAIPSAVLGGYDWGGRAACIVSALWPERARGLVSCGGYNIQDVDGSAKPQSPEAEHRYWYQYYFHSERGRAGLAQNRREFGKLLWKLWSPNWRFDDATYERTAASFDNPDFVDVVIHFVSSSLRPRARRSFRGEDGAAPRRAPADHGADSRAPRQRQWCSAGQELGAPHGIVHRTLRTAGDSTHRSQRAAGGAARVRSGNPVANLTSLCL